MSNDLQQARVTAAAKAMWGRDLEKSKEFYPERPSMWAKERPAYAEYAALALAAADAVVTVDAREHLHAKCDCVPDLGPAHCHLCSNEKGEPVPWPECVAVIAVTEEPEPVDVVLTTADVEKLAHLLVQLSPATQRNSGATVRRLLGEMNIKEVRS